MKVAVLDECCQYRVVLFTTIFTSVFNMLVYLSALARTCTQIRDKLFSVVTHSNGLAESKFQWIFVAY
jgi:hypothetical protein